MPWCASDINKKKNAGLVCTLKIHPEGVKHGSNYILNNHFSIRFDKFIPANEYLQTILTNLPYPKQLFPLTINKNKPFFLIFAVFDTLRNGILYIAHSKKKVPFLFVFCMSPISTNTPPPCEQIQQSLKWAPVKTICTLFHFIMFMYLQMIFHGLVREVTFTFQ